MFNVYDVADDKEKLLVEVDVRTLVTLLISYGISNDADLRHRLQAYTWNFTEEEARHAVEAISVFNPECTSYSEAKAIVIQKYREYCNERFGP